MPDGLLSQAVAPQNLTAGPTYAEAVRRRYQDAYLHANTVDGFGKIVKIVALIGGGLIALNGFLSCAGSAHSDSFGMAGIGILGGGIVFVLGVIIGFIGFAAGVLIQSAGQQLKAGLDCAVNGSHFLSDDDRAAAMGLR